jgi:hypothetical protein
MNLKLTKEQFEFLKIWISEDVDLEKKNTSLSKSAFKILKSINQKLNK